MPGCAFGAGEPPAAASSVGHLHAGRKQPPASVGFKRTSLVGWWGELGHADYVFLMVSLLGASGKALWAPGTTHWHVGWENALTAALAPVHLPLLIAARLQT